MTAETVIDVRGLTKAFGGKPVVNGLDMTIHEGEIFGFLGPNGSGKTTSIRMLCGLLTPDAGSGTCLGFDVIKEADRIKPHVGYMTQKFSLYEDLTVRENLDFTARIFGLKNPRRTVDECIERMSLAPFVDRLAGNLSGGWKQRLSLGASTLHSPKLLLLDEPTAGVDPGARRDFWDEVHNLASQGITALISTHYMDEAERCHRLAYIAYGTLLAAGTVEEMIHRAGLVTWSVTRKNGEAALHDLSAKLKPLPGCGPGGRLRQHPARQRPRPKSPGAGNFALQDGGIRLVPHRNQPGGGLHRPDAAKPGRAQMNCFSCKRFAAMVGKEFVQMRRDRLTFAMLIGIPLIQLILFGYAINSDPRHLPTALLSADNSPYSRAIVAGMQTSTYFDITARPKSRAELSRLIREGGVQFALTIPENFGRSLLRGDRPVLLLEADATDPMATGGAVGGLPGDRPPALLKELKGVKKGLNQTQPPVEIPHP